MRGGGGEYFFVTLFLCSRAAALVCSILHIPNSLGVSVKNFNGITFAVFVWACVFYELLHEYRNYKTNVLEYLNWSAQTEEGFYTTFEQKC